MDNNDKRDSFKELKLLNILRETAETLHDIGLGNEFLWLIALPLFWSRKTVYEISIKSIFHILP